MGKNFRALVIHELENGHFERLIENKNTDSLPQGELLISVHYSTLNYKDGLSAKGHKGITRCYPHTPGVDAAGIVEESQSKKFKVGDSVLVTGYDLGMNTSGGFAEYIRVPEKWVVKLPETLSLREAMIYGTAGFTAALSIYEIERHGIKPDMGKLLVTGATGGVGCLAVAMAANSGFHVIASTGKIQCKEFLKTIGAKEVIERNTVIDKSNKPLLPKRWIAAIDTVGGTTLSSIIRATDNRGVVTCMGLVESDKLETTVYPFILRGITLAGIDSAERPMDIRLKIWDDIAHRLRLKAPEYIVKEIGLENLSVEIDRILAAGQIGKVLVNLKK
ncbi:MAG: YhdH/YhfP family quinone oxidoreductase [Candidatus Kapabacteria bacterium]|nr:YhdH/YhfP family quinone oxidoreductase [Candidatus Kapabacteria bacterium]